MKFTFNQTWKETFGDAIEAVKDKIGDNKYPFSYGGAQWAQDYQFSKLPTKDMKYVKKLIVVRDNKGKIFTWKDILRITDPDKVDQPGWGSNTLRYLRSAGMIEKVRPQNYYVLTPLGQAVVDYAERN